MKNATTQITVMIKWFLIVSLIASRLIDGEQTEWSEYSIHGQKEKFRREGLPEKEGGWYLVPGKVDNISYLLLVFFALTFAFLFAFEAFI